MPRYAIFDKCYLDLHDADDPEAYKFIDVVEAPNPTAAMTLLAIRDMPPEDMDVDLYADDLTVINLDLFAKCQAKTETVKVTA